MANPIAPQGTLNRALTSVQVIQLPQLNVTAGYFGTKVARLTFEGDTADYIGTLTGAVPSPRLYQVVTITMYLNKSQGLSSLWELQRSTNASIGDVVITTDSTTLPDYFLNNCILQNIPDLELTGENNDYPVTLKGVYYINSSLFN
jgi:hypothetical protein